ncbi:MAG TPA: aspartate aminotransferase family protein, partial [Sphingobacterium sp.]|nr:aspartate aminotransferase family protein [Sphingobacterium sp.]
VIKEEKLVEQVERKSLLFKEKLRHPAIKEIRGLGLMMCLQLDSFDQVYNVSKYCAENGVMIDWYLHCETALRVAPPLTITDLEIEKACNIIIKGLEKYA